MDPLTRFANSNILVIEDTAAMRSQIVSVLTMQGFKNLWAVANTQKALAHLTSLPFALILCDYHLGDTTTGQQFLEYLRAKMIIPPSTLFVMVTARRAYEDVMRAAECLPDDYLVKPFTGAQLNTRLSKLIEKRNRFSSVHESMMKGDWLLVTRHCDAIIEARDRFAMDATKIKGQALLKLERWTQAELLYSAVIEQRPLGWARLGLARALKAQNSHKEAEELLSTLIGEGRNNSAIERMGAYDDLAEILRTTSRAKEALTLMQDAMVASPGSLQRTRKFANLAVSEGQMDLAEKTVRQLIVDNKHSQLKEASDYLMAADVLSTNGFAVDALGIVAEARKAFEDVRDQQVLAVAEVTALIGKGDLNAANRVLQTISKDTVGDLPPAAAAALGKSLYKVGDQEAADKVMRQLVQNNPDDPDVIQSVHAAMAAAGKQELSSALVESSIKEAADINNEGVRLAYAGKLDEAVAMLTQAAELLPGNMQFVSNAALVIALALSKGELDRDKLQACVKYRQMVVAREPKNPKIAQIDGLLKQLKSDAA